MNTTSISDLKAKAKDQLLGNYGMATGSFALLFVLIYSIVAVITSAFSFGFVQNSPEMFKNGLSSQLLSQVFGMIIGALSVLFSVGYIHILRSISRNEQPQMSDLFFVFRNHPDKIIIISFIMTGIQFILLLPATFVGGDSLLLSESLEIDAKRFLLWIVLYIAGIAISFVIDLMFAMSFMIYLDDPETEVLSIIKGSVSMMKGNKFRYFYMLLSFVGYWFLVIFSFGLAILWVMPYQTMTTLEFYNDLKHNEIPVDR